MWYKYQVVKEIPISAGCHNLRKGTYVYVNLQDLSKGSVQIITEDLEEINWVLVMNIPEYLDPVVTEPHPEDLTNRWNLIFTQTIH